MRKKNIVIIVSVILVIGFLSTYTENWHITESGAIPGNHKIIISQDTVYGKAAIYEDMKNQTFGAVKLNKKLGLFYEYGGLAEREFPEEDMPFQVVGFGNNVEQNDSFVVGIKVNRNSNIHSISLGYHKKITDYNESYEFSMKDIEAHPDKYLVKEVKNGYVLFVMDEYTHEGWTMRGFDKDGNMVADKLFSAQPRYTNW
ncbi:hypothetical protein [Paenibacillus sp. Marseille-Q4541]|uniref:hypothetical protein n=1 Tax=Paenibacillus sp. Marseille-Q4541 TaxID=2831522 RepID=UPI001BAC8983|nr:hypothetical protein [Paenibacillus sp. Marseille-Q4541]